MPLTGTDLNFDYGANSGQKAYLQSIFSLYPEKEPILNWWWAPWMEVVRSSEQQDSLGMKPLSQQNPLTWAFDSWTSVAKETAQLSSALQKLALAFSSLCILLVPTDVARQLMCAGIFIIQVLLLSLFFSCPVTTLLSPPEVCETSQRLTAACACQLSSLSFFFF